jgi:AICAR transformylase/IMP cyclohydrolase PurH (only IMP cyclohydrolase domain in Aful)
MKKIESALISVFYKDGLEPLVRKLNDLGVKLYSTGGTFKFIQDLGLPVTSVESVTGYPSILGGRVKTLSPKIMGGILARRDNTTDSEEMHRYDLPYIDMVVVDLYPFEQTLKGTTETQSIIEKIDIGGITLIRAAAKNYKDVLIVPSVDYYAQVLDLLTRKNGVTDLEDRELFATYAFGVSSYYDTKIFAYFNTERQLPLFRQAYNHGKQLRYGENPHQKGYFFGVLEDDFTQLHGKEISYNNLGDIEAACNLIDDFEDTTFAIIKHNNACGLASRKTLQEAYETALSSDPLSAYGGVFVCNREIDKQTAEQMNKIFMEVCIAPAFSKEALEILTCKKNRVLLERKHTQKTAVQFKSALNGVLVQDRDCITEKVEDMHSVTSTELTNEQKEDLAFANKIVKHTKSNAIVLAKNCQLLASGTGQTSRVDALKQAIDKAGNFKMNLQGAVMASDAFFPFADCVEIADKAGIKAVVHPGGSIRDNDSITYCQEHNMAMAITGYRHFKH